MLKSGKRNGNWEICVMNPAKLRESLLTQCQYRDDLPRWSPTRDRIAYVCRRELRVMAADGSDDRKLADIEGRPHPSTWSPDGRRIAFSSGPPDNRRLYVVDVKSGRVEAVTRESAHWPAWRP